MSLKIQKMILNRLMNFILQNSKISLMSYKTSCNSLTIYRFRKYVILFIRYIGTEK